MKATLIPGTDLTVSRLSFGTASLHHIFRSHQRQGLLAAAIDAGFSHLDTSPYYGYGLAEEAVGLLINSGVDKLTIASKIGLYPPAGSSANSAQVVARKLVGRVIPKASLPVQNWTLKRAQTSLENTLRRIRRDYLDILYLHEPVFGCLDEVEFVGWLESQRNLGKIRYWGLAGDSTRFGKWLEYDQPLAQILQVKRSLDDVGAVSTSRTHQFSYGYLSSAQNQLQGGVASEILGKALHMNPEGSIIVSTRKLARVTELARAAL